MPAAAALALAVALGLGAASTVAVLVLAVLLVQALVVVRWYGAVEIPGARGGVLLAAGVAVAADLLVASRDGPHPMSPAAAVGGVAVLAALAHQLTRRDGRPRLTASLATTVLLAALVLLAAGYLAAAVGDEGPELVAAGAACAGLVAAMAWLPGPPWRARTTGVLVAVGAGALVLLVGGAALRTTVVAPLAATLVASIGQLVPARFARPDPWLSAALPVLLVGPAVFLLGRVLST